MEGYGDGYVAAARAPRWPVAAAVALALAAAGALFVAPGSLGIAVPGYVVGALAVPCLTVLHRFFRQSAAKSPYYLPDLKLERLMLLALGLGLVAGVAHAWFVATELAKQ